MAESAIIGVDIDLSMVNKRLAQTGELTAKEARQMQRELTTAFKAASRESASAAKSIARSQSKAVRDAEREAKRAANAIKSSINEQTSAVRGLSSAAFGGMAGDLFDVADASAGASGALGAVGLALGALAVAPVVLGGMVTGLKSVIDSASESADALRELGPEFEALVSPATLAALDEYDTQMQRLGVAADVAQAEIGAALVPFIRDLASALVAIAPAAREASAAIAAVYAHKEDVQLFARVLHGVGTFGFSELVRGAGSADVALETLASEFDDAAQAAEDATRSMADQASMLAMLGMTITDEAQAEMVAERAKRAKAAADLAAKEAASEHEAKVRELMAAVRDGTIAVSDATAGYTSLDLSMQGVTENAGLTRDAVIEINEAAAESSRIIGGEGEPSPFEKLWHDLGKAAKAVVATAGAMSGLVGNVEQLAAIEQRQHEDRIRQLRDQRAASRETYQTAALDYESSRADMTVTERIAQEDYLARLAQSEAAKRKQMREIELEERRAAMEAYKRQKALQLVQIAIDSARNAVALTPAFAYAGFYAPLIATGVASAQGVTAAMLVNSQPAPAFHFGTSAAAGAGAQNPAGIVGAEVPAVLEQGEGVISRRGMAAPGMADLVQMANDGRAPSERSTITDTEADMLAQRLNRPYAPNIRGRAEAGRNTFYRGR